MDIKKWAQQNIDAGDRCVETLKSQLDQNPGYALEWSKSTFQAIGLKEACEQLLAYLEGDVPLDQIFAWLRQAVNQKAHSPEFSSSPTSNLMHQYRLAGLAQVLIELEFSHR